MTTSTPATAADFYWPVVVGIVGVMALVMIWHEMSATREHLKRIRKRDEQRRFGLEKELERGAIISVARDVARAETTRLLNEHIAAFNEAQKETKNVTTDLGSRRFIPLHKNV